MRFTYAPERPTTIACGAWIYQYIQPAAPVCSSLPCMQSLRRTEEPQLDFQRRNAKTSLSLWVSLPKYTGLCWHTAEAPHSSEGPSSCSFNNRICLAWLPREWASLRVLLLSWTVRLEVYIVTASKAGRRQFKETWGISLACWENHRPAAFGHSPDPSATG